MAIATRKVFAATSGEPQNRLLGVDRDQKQRGIRADMIVLIDFDEVTELVNIESTPPLTQDELVAFLRDCIDNLTDPEPVH